MKLLAAVALLLTVTASAFADTFVYVSIAGEKKIALYGLDPAEGKLSHKADVPTDGEPDALAVDPGRHFLFASLRSVGNLASFRIDRETGKLTHVSTVSAGADPAYLATDCTGRFLLTAYYQAGKVTVHAVGKDGTLGDSPLQTVATAEKAHAVVPDPSNRFAFVPHTGPNALFQFAFDPDSGKLTANDPAQVQTRRTPAPATSSFTRRRPSPTSITSRAAASPPMPSTQRPRQRRLFRIERWRPAVGQRAGARGGDAALP
jgi:6-phosphogluconolactonase